MDILATETTLPTPSSAPPSGVPDATPDAPPAIGDASDLVPDAETSGAAPVGVITSEWVRPPLPAVIKRPPPAGRRRRGEAAGKPGPPSWIWGTKFVFFDRRKGEFGEAVRNNTTGIFYTKMAKLYKLKYEDMAEDEDFAVDFEDPPDEAANVVVNLRLAPDVLRKRQQEHTAVRTRIGAWYRGQNSSLLKDEKTTLGALLGGLLGGMAHLQPKPRRPHLVHYYSGKYYDARVEPRVALRMKELEKRAGFSGETVAHRIVVQNEVTKEVWEEETEEFQRETLRQMEVEYGATLKAWRDSLADSPAHTPEEFSTSLKSAAHYLQPFCDAIEERFGMVVSLMLCGPVGDRGGRIEMRSLHSGKTRGLVEKDWPMHDPQGFRAVETSMVEFAREVFTKAECTARVTAVQDPNYVAGAIPGPAVAVTATAPVAGSVTPAAAAAPTGAPSLTPAPPTLGSVPRAQVGDDAGVQPSPATAGVDDDARNEGTGGGVAGNETSEEVAARCWNRKDRGRWTLELQAAHAAFERGKGWGLEWATCVERFFDFEGACGFTEGGQIATSDRPKAVKWWLGRARKWETRVDIGVVGAEGKEDTFVDMWWKWWKGSQKEGDIRSLVRLHGRNGLLQVMASLLWWGEAVASSPLDVLAWSAAVSKVSDALHEMLRPGLIEKELARPGAGANKGKGKRRAVESDEEDQNEGEDYEEEDEERDYGELDTERTKGAASSGLRERQETRGARAAREKAAGAKAVGEKAKPAKKDAEKGRKRAEVEKGRAARKKRKT